MMYIPLSYIQLHLLTLILSLLYSCRGDFGTGYFGVALDDQSARQLRLLNVEVSNGRLAMLGILGMFASEKIHGVPLWETHIFG
jgi:hypothetical protein